MRYDGNWVIERGTYTAHVHSDNAMIDSGHAEYIVVWREAEGVTERTDFSLGRGGDGPVVDASEPTPDAARQAANEYTAAMNWVVKMAAKCREAKQRRPQKGDTVKVVKGRKAPKGTYVVTASGENDWGVYLHLVNEAGGTYKYINPENVKAEVAPPKDVPAKYLGMLSAIGDDRLGREVNWEDERRRLTALALADAMEEEGDERACHLRAFIAYYLDLDNYRRWSLGSGDYFTRPAWCRNCGREQRLPHDQAEAQCSQCIVFTVR